MSILDWTDEHSWTDEDSAALDEEILAHFPKYAMGQTQKALARKYGVTKGSIWNAIHGRTWRRVA